MLANLAAPCHLYIPGPAGHTDGIALYWETPTLEEPRQIAVVRNLPSMALGFRKAAHLGFTSITVHREA